MLSLKILLYSLCKRTDKISSTVKPVYKGQPWDLKKTGRLKEVPDKSEI
jgi:hypothetical protein